MTGDGKKRVAIVVGEATRESAAEAARAAVGLTLRGDQITVVGELEARASATLEMFGHRVVGIEALDQALDADAIEIWGRAPDDAAPGHAATARAQAVLHVVRPGRRAAAVAPGERVVHLDGIDDDQLLDLVLAAGAVAVW